MSSILNGVDDDQVSRTEIGKRSREPSLNASRRKRMRTELDTEQHQYHEDSDVGLSKNHKPHLTTQNSSSLRSPRDGQSVGSAKDSSLRPGLDMAAANLGNNRLATGFVKSASQADTAASLSVGTDNESSSGQDVITISDEEDEDMTDADHGGMQINVKDQQIPQVVVADDSDSGYDPEEHMLRNREASPSDGQQQQKLFVIDSASTVLVKQLRDLTPTQLEDQIKYAFYYLERDQIDLGRPVACLACQQEGHLDEDCETNSTGFFPRPIVPPDNPFRLWISCCVCASKSHLVGDCPDVEDPARVARWSLKGVDPTQITNLSLETGTRRLEKEAETRGMRPSGLSIKGGAERYTAGFGQDDESSEEEGLIRQPLHPQARTNNRNNRTIHHSPHQQSPRGPRSRGDWYSTDSFGRRRSRSRSPEKGNRPSRRDNQWENDNDFRSKRRSPSPRRRSGNSYPHSRDTPAAAGDSWRPHDHHAAAAAANIPPSPRRRVAAPPPPNQRPAPSKPQIQISLPRRPSNSQLHAQQNGTNSTATSSSSSVIATTTPTTPGQQGTRPAGGKKRSRRTNKQKSNQSQMPAKEQG